MEETHLISIWSAQQAVQKGAIMCPLAGQIQLIMFDPLPRQYITKQLLNLQCVYLITSYLLHLH